ncbi:MAG: class I SAM-dependent methyltransferase [Planctomycetes bacterium]|jgi:16S rRNA (guanine1516-N2)-methyltransferase|nr:class I SAM-dependent methyltransferase [Planctomycetota bacterium]
MTSTRVGVTTDHADLESRAAALSAELGLPRGADADALLVVTPERLEVRVQRGDPTLVRARPTWIDLTSLDTTSGPGRSLQNPLLKAVGIRKGDPHRPAVIDLTAGFGEDAWLLAAAGCTVTACEQHPVLFALLRDALRRAAATHPDLAARIRLHHADAVTWLARSDIDHRQTRILYLDPMFPAKRKTAQRKPMRLARLLLGQDEAAAEAATARLFAAALGAGGRRVVVKRPAKAPPLTPAMAQPVASHAGRALRFDVYGPAAK